MGFSTWWRLMTMGIPDPAGSVFTIGQQSFCERGVGSKKAQQAVLRPLWTAGCVEAAWHSVDLKPVREVGQNQCSFGPHRFDGFLEGNASCSCAFPARKRGRTRGIAGQRA